MIENDGTTIPNTEISGIVTSKRYSWLCIAITVGFLVYTFCTRLAMLSYHIHVLDLACKFSRGPTSKIDSTRFAKASR